MSYVARARARAALGVIDVPGPMTVWTQRRGFKTCGLSSLVLWFLSRTWTTTVWVRGEPGQWVHVYEASRPREKGRL